MDTKIAAASTSTDRISSLVETFAAELDAKSNGGGGGGGGRGGGTAASKHPLHPSSRVNQYQVNGNVGAMIAQKLQDGEGLRVGRNGEQLPKHPEVSDFFKDVNKA